MEYPALVYKDGGPHPRARGTYSCRAVSDDAELAAALAQGWRTNLDAPEAPPTPAPLTDPEAEFAKLFATTPPPSPAPRKRGNS